VIGMDHIYASLCGSVLYQRPAHRTIAQITFRREGRPHLRHGAVDAALDQRELWQRDDVDAARAKHHVKLRLLAATEIILTAIVGLALLSLFLLA